MAVKWMDRMTTLTMGMQEVVPVQLCSLAFTQRRYGLNFYPNVTVHLLGELVYALLCSTYFWGEKYCRFLGHIEYQSQQEFYFWLRKLDSYFCVYISLLPDFVTLGFTSFCLLFFFLCVTPLSFVSS
jgi:hypothetical protein